MLTTLSGTTYKSDGITSYKGIISPNTGHLNLDYKPPAMTSDGTSVGTGSKFDLSHYMRKKSELIEDRYSTPSKSTSINFQPINGKETTFPADYSSLPESNLTQEDYERINRSGASGNMQDDFNTTTELKKAVINLPVLIVAGLIVAYLLGK